MKKMYDLSQPFFNEMPYAPNIGPFHAERVMSHENGDQLQVTRYQFCSHTGTHLDAPRHIFAGGKTIDQIPLERLKSRCVIVEAVKQPFEEITVQDVLDNGVEILPGDYVFFHTGFSEKFMQPDYVNNASISIELANWLVEKHVGIVGIDCNTIDQTYCLRKPDFDFPVHHILLGNDILVIEHLKLDHIPEKVLNVSVFALNILGADGSPVRVIGESL